MLETRGVTGTPAFGETGTRAAPGKKPHREDCKAGPDPWLAPVIEPICEQRCLPARRQQAGSFESGSGAKADKGISEKLKRPSKTAASVRRTTEWYPLEGRAVNTVGVRPVEYVAIARGNTGRDMMYIELEVPT